MQNEEVDLYLIVFIIIHCEIEEIMSIVVFVISGYRFGHLTRQKAVIDELLNLKQDINVRLVVSPKHYDLISQQDIDDRITLYNSPITPTIVMEDDTRIDKETSEYSYKMSLDYHAQIRDDLEWGRILNGADLVINDIDSIHNEIVNKMQIPMINISNFTWSDILRGLGSIELAEAYAKQVERADYHYQLPLSTKCEGFIHPIKVGYISRKVDNKFIENMKNTYQNKNFIFISNPCKTILQNFDDFIGKLQDINLVPIFKEDFIHLIKQPKLLITYKEKSEDTHNLVALSDIAIIKAGYSTVAEAMVGGTFMLFWTRQTVEDKAIAKEIIKEGFGEEIEFDCKVDILVEKVTRALILNEDRPLVAMKNETDKLAEIIVSKHLS